MLSFPRPRVLLQATLALLTLSASAFADVLANTAADFSTAAQGTAGFEYGYYAGVNDTSAPFSTAGMTANAASWNGTEGSSTPGHSQADIHPGLGRSPAVRRYTVGSSGEAAYTGALRLVGRFFDLNTGDTDAFIAVDPDGDAGPEPRTLLLAPTPVRGTQNLAVDFDLTVSVQPGTTIDFGVIAGGDAFSDSTGLVAWLVTGDSPAPTRVVANVYHSTDWPYSAAGQDVRGLALVKVTDGQAGAADADCFDTAPSALGYPQFAGLLYLQAPGSGKLTQFDRVRVDIGAAFPDGGDFATFPRLFLLEHNSDPDTSHPLADARYRAVAANASKSVNAAGRPYYEFDLTGIAAAERRGYGFAVVGEGSGSGRFISVAELSAVATEVPEAGFVPVHPRFYEFGGHRYGITFTRGTWLECEAEAVARGGHLVAINSPAEQQFITNTFGSPETYYIGLRQTPGDPDFSEPGGGFKWTTGEPLTFTNWSPGEPNNYTGAGEDFVQFGPNAMSWGDVSNQGYPATSSYRGIIELANTGDPNAPREHQLVVSGQANVFGAGQVNPTPCVNAGTGGVAALSVAAFEGEVVRIAGALGSIWTGAESAGPDGAHNPPRVCDITGVGGVSGYKNLNNTAHLVGVFVGDTPLASTPARLDFSTAGLGEDFANLAPGLGQVFFIGDGVTSSGAVQEFVAPAGATKLYVGIPDAYEGNSTLIYTGPPNAYSDNSGAYYVQLSVSPSPLPRFLDTRFPASGTPLRISGGQPPYAPVEVSAGNLPPGVTIADKTVQGRATEEGAFPFTLRTVDTANNEATKAFTLNVAAVPRDLIAWWKADADAQDSAGTNHGTFFGNATVASGGIVGGKAFLFDGEDDYVRVLDDDPLDLTGDFTIECWVKLFSNTGQEPTIVSKRHADDHEAYVLFVKADGRLTFASRALDSQSRDWVETSTPAGVTVGNDGQWTHVAVTCAGSTMKFYINGALVQTGTHPARPPTFSPLTIGAGTDGSNVFGEWDGFIDELSIYDRALTAAEISSVASADSMGKVIRVKPAIVDDAFPFAGGQLTIEGGTGPYTVTVAAGSLPAGLSVFSTGEVGGTAANGAYSFTLRVTDAAGKSTERAFTGAIENPIAPPAGLTAWWPADDTVADIINGDHVGATSPAYTSGKVGRAFSFNGTSESLQTQQPTGVLNAGSLTIEAWVKPEVRSDGVASDLFPANVVCNDKRNFGGVGIGANVFASGSSLWIELQTENPADAHHQVTGATLAAGEWAHVALVLTSGNAKTYVNGARVESFDYAQGALDGDTTVRIGRHNDDTGFGSRRFFKGAIDEASIYDRALTDAEIAQLFAAGSGGKKRYDAAREFATDFPQTAGALWTYGVLPAGPINFANFSLCDSYSKGASVEGWVRSIAGDPAGVGRNFTGNPVTIFGAGGTPIVWAPGQMHQHPSSNNDYSVVRWTAPQPGRYAVSGSFTGIDAHGVTTDVHVYHKSTALYNDAIANEFLGNGHCYTGAVEAEAGDTVDFIIGPNGNYSFDTTGLVASVVYLGPKLAAPNDLAIQTAAPPTSDRSWLFAVDDADEIDGLSLRLQFAEADTPNTWADLSADTMTRSGDDSATWTQVVNPLGLPAGNFYFRAVASAPGLGDKPSAAFGIEAVDSASTGPIPVLVPGAPPPPPPKLPMPPVTKFTVKVGTSSKITNTRQGAVFTFDATQSLGGVRTLPAETTVRVQYSYTPADENSWANLDDSKMDLVKKTATTASYRLVTSKIPNTDGRPDGEQGLFFRTRTEAPGRLSTAGPLVRDAVAPVGPYVIASGPYWRYVVCNHESPSDGTGATTFSGDTVTYHVRLKNEQDSGGPATNVKVIMIAPSGTVVVPRPAMGATSDDTSAGASKSAPSRVEWTIPSVARDETVELLMKVRVTAKPYKVITMPLGNITVKCDQIAAVKAEPERLRAGQSMTTYVSSGLAIRVSSSPKIARLGDVVDFEIQASNKSSEAVTDAEVTFRVPAGMFVNQLRTQNGSGNFTDLPLPNPTPATNPGLSEYRLDEKQLITWKLGTVPANSQRTMRFSLRVQYDLVTFYADKNGVFQTTTLTAEEYNLTAKNGSGTTLRAFKSASLAPEVDTLLSAEPPLVGAPVLSLTKSAAADGSVASATAPDAETRDTLQVAGIGEASTVLQGKRLTYKLSYANAYGAGPATNATIHEEIPDGAVFTGFIRRGEPFTDSNHNLRRDAGESYTDVNGNGKFDSALVDSYFGFTFRNKDGQVMPGEGELFFDDSNHNGRADRGEYSDENHNGRYDGITDVKFIDFNLGTLAAGASGSISYDVFPSGAPGSVIISRSGGAIVPKVKKGQQYEGFSITSENIYTPVAGNPFKLVSLVVAPATFDLQDPVLADRSAIAAGGSLAFEIPYRVNGGQGLQFANMTVTAYVQKSFGVDVSRTGHVNTSLPLGSSLRPLVTTAGVIGPVNAKTGEYPVTFNLGNFDYGREGVIRVTLTLPDPLPAEMLNDKGYLRESSYFRVAKTDGGFFAPAAPGEGPARGGGGSVVLMPPAGRLAALPVFGPSNTNLFVGRVSPLAVDPGQPFNVIVFFGNASARLAQGGTVTMKIPPGTTLTNVSPVAYHYSGSGEESRYERNEFWRTQKLPNGQMAFELETLDLFPHDMGAVTLTLVANNVQGDRIEDNSLTVQTPNSLGRAAPKMSIVIRRQNIFSAIGNFFGSLLGGVLDIFNGTASDALKPYESTLGDGSRMIGISGADLVHLTNGSVVVPLGGSRTMAAGPVDVVVAPEFNTLADDGVTRLAVGKDYTPGFEIQQVNASTSVWKPADVIYGLRFPGSSLVAAGAGNLVAAGGLNLVAAGGLNLIDNSNGASINAISPHNANLVAAGGLNMVAAGGGNLVAAGGLNLVAAGAGNLVAAGGGNLVAAGGLNLVAAGGGNLVAAGGGNLVAAGAGNLVAAGGLNLLASDTPKLIGLDHASLQAVGGNLTNIQATSLIRLNGAEILSHNGGQILSHNGGQ